MTSRALARRLAAEFIGTFALVFAGYGTIIVNAKTGALGHVGIRERWSVIR
jgi:glycerol uptake facilitator-like aquaporin